MSRASSGRRTQSRQWWPASSRRTARVVPQPPEPRMAMVSDTDGLLSMGGSSLTLKHSGLEGRWLCGRGGMGYTLRVSPERERGRRSLYQVD